MHNFNVCPAAEVTCFHCKKKCHYARKCKSHTAHEVEAEEVEEMYDHFYIETISLNPPNVDVHVNNIKSCEQQKEKRVPLSVEGKKISFKLDTGSEVNILPFHMYESHCSKTNLVPTKAKLVGYFGNSSKPHGEVLLHVEHKHKFYPVEFMVVDSKNPIISLSTCKDLNLVRFVDEIEQSDLRLSNEILKDPKYKSVFKNRLSILRAKFRTRC